MVAVVANCGSQTFKKKSELIRRSQTIVPKKTAENLTSQKKTEASLIDGIQEVSGSIPLISTKGTRTKTKVFVLFLYFFGHLEKEQNGHGSQKR